MNERWDVFLSYARKDDEASSFVTDLYGLLTGPRYGLRVWFDRKSMPSRGRGFVEEIARAIASSERVLLVLGDEALRSEYVRAEWQYALSQELPVVPLLELRDPPSDAKQAYALVPAELRTLHVENVCGKTAAASVERIAELLRAPRPKLGPLSAELPNAPERFEPRPDATAALAQRLILTRPEQLRDKRRFVVLHGMSGTGKSVVVAAFARALSTRIGFGDGVVWLRAPRLGAEATEETIRNSLKRVLERQLAAVPDLNRFTDPSVLQRPDVALLVIVDDAQTALPLEFLWDALGVRCRVLVTTQQAQLATTFGADELRLEPLTTDAGLALLARYSGSTPDALPKAARDVASLCGGIPFALAVAGALVADGDSWQDLDAKLQHSDLQGLAHAIHGYPHPSVFAMLDVAVRRLPPDEQTLFRLLHVFADTLPVPESVLVLLWGKRTQGRPDQMRSLLTRLIRASLLASDGSSPDRSVRIHDLLIRYCRATDNRGERAIAAELLEARTANGEAPADPASEMYWQRALLRHMDQADDSDAAFRLLTRIEGGIHSWYAAKLSAGDFSGYLSDVGTGWALQDRHTPAPNGLERLVLYALLATGTRALAETVPVHLWNALSDSGAIPLTMLRSRAMLLGDPADRARALLALFASAVGIEEPWVLAVRDAAAQSEPAAQVELLTRLAARVDDSALPELLGECVAATDALQGARRALALARMAAEKRLATLGSIQRWVDEAFGLAVAYPSDPIAHDALVTLIDSLTPEQRRVAVDLVFQNGRMPSGTFEPLARADCRRRFSRVLPLLDAAQTSVLAETLKKDKDRDPGALEPFAQILPEDFMRERWEKAISDSKQERAMFVTQPVVEAVRLLSRRAPVPVLVEEALAVARRETSLHRSFGSYGKPMALARLVELCAEPVRTSCWNEALSSARQMTRRDDQVKVLISLAEVAPEGKRSDVLRQAWECTLRVSDESEIFSALKSAVHFVDRAGVDEILDMARARREKGERFDYQDIVATAAARLGELGEAETGLSLVMKSTDLQTPAAWSALSELVSVLPDALIDSSWHKIDCTEKLRSSVGADLIAQFVTRRPGLFEEVIARSTDSHGKAPSSWYWFILGLSRRGLLVEALEAAKAAPPSDTRRDIVLSIAASAPDETPAKEVNAFCAQFSGRRRPKVVALLGPKLVGDQRFKEAVEALDLGPGGRDWFDCGLDVLEDSTEDFEVRLFDAGLEAVQHWTDPADRVWALGILSSHVNRGAVDTFQRIVEAQDPQYHRHFLEFPGRLAKLGLLDVALRVARAFPSHASTARALCPIAGHPPSPTILLEALEACCRDASWADRSKALSAIIDLVKAGPEEQSLALFKVALHRLASRGRSDFIMDCRTIVKWVSTLGGSKAVVALVRTLNQTTAAWA